MGDGESSAVVSHETHLNTVEAPVGERGGVPGAMGVIEPTLEHGWGRDLLTSFTRTLPAGRLRWKTLPDPSLESRFPLLPSALARATAALPPAALGGPLAVPGLD